MFNIMEWLKEKTTEEFADTVMMFLRPIKTIKRITDPGYGIK